MAVGAVCARALLQFSPPPTHLIFDVLLAAVALPSVAAFFFPEAVGPPRPLSWQSLKPALPVPAPPPKAMWTRMPLSTAQWALGGLYLSLGPTLAKVITANSAPLTGGALLGALLLSAPVSILVVRHRDARTALTFAAAALMVGVALTLAAVQFQS